ncbi:hypothetical protein NITHO_4270003 [Nitrolancea hollandica Lb]|uniref:Uncharacterized protein n=1 Tax=Nitrolancea hollandica Lb TaxID=1129897 RepID=I4EJW6_9BACT|nr:hypothetical protein NITHO_4270003 [Nitrolancea hollandica Lb]
MTRAVVASGDGLLAPHRPHSIAGLVYMLQSLPRGYNISLGNLNDCYPVTVANSTPHPAWLPYRPSPCLDWGSIAGDLSARQSS